MLHVWRVIAIFYDSRGIHKSTERRRETSNLKVPNDGMVGNGDDEAFAIIGMEG
jgi:hypothetical protein